MTHQYMEIKIKELEKKIKALEQEPCEDAVSRKALKEHLRARLYESAINNTDYTCVASETFEDIADNRLDIWISELPSVRPTRKKAKWDRGYTFPDGEYWKCSQCGELIKVKIPMRFCNNCGAEMESDI